MRGWAFAWLLAGAFGLCATKGSQQAQIEPQVVARAVSDSRVTVVHLAPRYATAIRLHEAVHSVVLGDPAAFSVEHSEEEPNLVFVKPITTEPAQTNLLISTRDGHQVGLLLISPGESHREKPWKVDFLLRYRPVGRFLIEPSDAPSVLLARTQRLREPQTAALESGHSVLDELLERQRRARLPKLFGAKPGVRNPGKELLKAGVSEVIDQGREVVVLFSVVNPQQHAIELMPPQIQLGGKLRSGGLFKKSRWGTAEQFPIKDYRLSQRRLGPGERADGVVVFDRPPYKQSHETLLLQMAESGAVDRPALAPIGFGISSFDFNREDTDAGAESAPADIEGRAVVRKFLESYLSYTPTSVERQLADALNLMTHNLRQFTLGKLREQDTVGTVKQETITSRFQLRSIEPVDKQPWTYVAFGVKEVHRIRQQIERTDRIVGRYTLRLIEERRSERNPSGLLVAEYKEEQMVGEQDVGLKQKSSLLPGH